MPRVYTVQYAYITITVVVRYMEAKLVENGIVDGSIWINIVSFKSNTSMLVYWY